METLGKVVRHVRTFVNLTRILLPSSQSAKRTGTKDPRSKDFPDLQKRGLVSKSLTRGRPGAWIHEMSVRRNEFVVRWGSRFEGTVMYKFYKEGSGSRRG
jgi:hypothetical protein